MEKYLPETFQWLRNISTLVIHSDIDRSGFAEMNTENMHPDTRGSIGNGQCRERRQCKQRSSFNPYTKSPDSVG